MENILEIRNLTKTYPGFQLKNISLTIPKGTIMGFIGENGAGKTTTIKAILQLIQADSGSISVFGKDMKGHEKLNKEDIGVVLNGSLFPEGIKCKKIDGVLKNIYQNWDSPLYMQYLQRFSVPLDKQIKELSTGMKMKLSIAIALAHHPKLLILDEATSGLDPIVREEILDIFLEFIQDEEHSVFISSHITSDIEKVADYVTFLHNGSILLSEEKDVLLSNYGILKTTSATFATLSKSEYAGYRKNSYVIEVLVKDKADILRRYPNEVVDPASLEDILLYSVKGER